MSSIGVYLNTWPPVGGIVGGLDGGRIIGAGFEILELHFTSSSVSLLV